MSPDEVIARLQDAYAWLNGLHVSANTLIALALLFTIAGILAIREAIAWFLKIHDLKRDIARLQEISFQLEGEIRVLQELMPNAAVAVEVAAIEADQDNGPSAMHEPKDAKNAGKGTFTITH